MKIVVFRNNFLDFVELEMKAGGFLDYGTEPKNPDFARPLSMDATTNSSIWRT